MDSPFVMLGRRHLHAILVSPGAGFLLVLVGERLEDTRYIPAGGGLRCLW